MKFFSTFYCNLIFAAIMLIVGIGLHSSIFANERCVGLLSESQRLLTIGISNDSMGLKSTIENVSKIQVTICACVDSISEKESQKAAYLTCVALQARNRQLNGKLKKLRRGDSTDTTSHVDVLKPDTNESKTDDVSSGWEHYRKILNIISSRSSLFQEMHSQIRSMFADKNSIVLTIKDETDKDTIRQFLSSVAEALEKGIATGTLSGKSIDSTLSALLSTIEGNGRSIDMQDSIAVHIAQLALLRIYKNPSLYPAVLKILREDEGSLLLDIILNQEKIEWALRQRGIEHKARIKQTIESSMGQGRNHLDTPDSIFTRIGGSARAILKSNKKTGITAVALMPFPREGEQSLPKESGTIELLRNGLMEKLAKNYFTIDIDEYADNDELTDQVERAIGDAVPSNIFKRIFKNSPSSENQKFIILCPFVVDNAKKRIDLYVQVATLPHGTVIAAIHSVISTEISQSLIAQETDSILARLKFALINTALFDRYQESVLDTSAGDVQILPENNEGLSLYSNKALNIRTPSPGKLVNLLHINSISVAPIPNSGVDLNTRFMKTFEEALKVNFRCAFVNSTAGNDTTLIIYSDVANSPKKELSLYFLVKNDTLFKTVLPSMNDTAFDEVDACFASDMLCGVLSKYFESNMVIVKNVVADTSSVVPPLQIKKPSAWNALPAFFPAGALQLVHFNSLGNPENRTSVLRAFYRGGLITLIAAQLACMGSALWFDQKAISAEKKGDRGKANLMLNRTNKLFKASMILGCVGSVSFLVDLEI